MIIEFDTCIMRYVWLKGKVTCSEKTCICVSDGYKFSPHSSQTTHLLIGFNYIQVPLCIPGVKIFKGGELEANVRVISLLKLFTSNK